MNKGFGNIVSHKPIVEYIESVSKSSRPTSAVSHFASKRYGSVSRYSTHFNSTRGDPLVAGHSLYENMQDARKQVSGIVSSYFKKI